MYRHPSGTVEVHVIGATADYRPIMCMASMPWDVSNQSSLLRRLLYVKKSLSCSSIGAKWFHLTVFSKHPPPHIASNNSTIPIKSIISTISTGRRESPTTDNTVPTARRELSIYIYPSERRELGSQYMDFTSSGSIASSRNGEREREREREREKGCRSKVCNHDHSNIRYCPTK
jgi:hypothetical protein